MIIIISITISICIIISSISIIIVFILSSISIISIIIIISSSSSRSNLLSFLLRCGIWPNETQTHLWMIASLAC